MRSRDGDKSFLCRYCALGLFFLCMPALYGAEYFISYRYVVKNAVLLNESLQVSRAMKKCSGTPETSLLLDYNKHSKLKDILQANEEEFFHYISKLGLHVSHREKISNMQSSSTTIVTLKTTCFKVDFNDNFVKISALK